MSNDRSNKTYPLPLEIILTIDFKTILLLLFFSILFILMPFIFNYEKIKSSDTIYFIVLYVILPLIGLSLIIGPFYQNIFKRVRVIITSDNITYIHILGKKTISWDEIIKIDTYTRQNNTFIGFTTNDTVENKKHVMHGFFTPGTSRDSRYAMGIPLAQINSHDLDRVIQTIYDAHAAHTKK